MKTLQQLIDLGVKELRVTNHEAVAVNPYDDAPEHFNSDQFAIEIIPPLPCPTVEDGTYPIEAFEEKVEYRESQDNLNSNEWFQYEDRIRGVFSKHSIKHETKSALYLKQNQPNASDQLKLEQKYKDPKKYAYTNAEWQRTIESIGIEYFNEGDVIETYNNRTGKTVTYVIEVKKVATQTSKDWTKTSKC